MHKILESTNCRFEDVFLEGARFHCFSGKPVVWRKAIEAINEEDTEKKEKQWQRNSFSKSFKHCFCSDQRLKETSSQKEDQLAKTSEDFSNMSLNEMLSDAESYTAFDYCK